METVDPAVSVVWVVRTCPFMAITLSGWNFLHWFTTSVVVIRHLVIGNTVQSFRKNNTSLKVMFAPKYLIVACISFLWRFSPPTGWNPDCSSRPVLATFINSRWQLEHHKSTHKRSASSHYNGDPSAYTKHWSNPSPLPLPYAGNW